MKRYILWGILLVSLLGSGPFAGRACAVVIEGVEFEASTTVNERELRLRGVALLRYMVVIKAYVGGLYLPENVPPDQVLDNIPKRLVLHYFHAIKAGDFYTATRKMIEKNMGPADREAIEEQLVRLGETYMDIEPHDRYALTYWPGYGTELTLNGMVLGFFEGDLFARAMFSIWLGEYPIDKGFRDRLTGKK